MCNLKQWSHIYIYIDCLAVKYGIKVNSSVKLNVIMVNLQFSHSCIKVMFWEW